MKNKVAVLLLTLVAFAATSAMAGSKNPVVGGQPMYPTKDIIDNAVNSADHTTLVAAVKAAGLVDTLKGSGPFTVFRVRWIAMNRNCRDHATFFRVVAMYGRDGNSDSYKGRIFLN